MRVTGNGSLMPFAPVTHAAPRAVEACADFVQFLRDAILGQPDVLKLRAWSGEPAITASAAGSWRQKPRDQIRSSGDVITTSTFEDALILAVTLGDADTIGATAGQLAGALYGASAIPERWLHHLAWRSRISAVADRLLANHPDGNS